MSNYSLIEQNAYMKHSEETEEDFIDYGLFYWVDKSKC